MATEPILRENEKKPVEKPIEAPKIQEQKPETKSESGKEHKRIDVVEHVAIEQAPMAVPSSAIHKVPPVKKDKIALSVESALSEGLEELYMSMSPKDKKRFKEEGDKIASIISDMIRKAKINTRKIRDLVFKWLRLIPGVSKFFLEKEAKIRTQKILFIAKEEKTKQI
ncbi:MAG: hypothetical protein ACD_76C00157G0002 [uncultured bacterium]|nr:MAG: hypothetical protein ACD_76C00157G0002 [uncultured bacterium]HBD05168.1 hypothetical protein [Candidatus Uhrbacteria bacterium]